MAFISLGLKFLSVRSGAFGATLDEISWETGDVIAWDDGDLLAWD